ncbi:MAG: hypothetical protein Q9201_006101 [Fulgogasparrea decipioides]
MANQKQSDTLGAHPQLYNHDHESHTSDSGNGWVRSPNNHISKEDTIEESLSKGQKHNEARRIAKRKRRRRSESLLGQLCHFIGKHQIGLAANLLTLLTMTHMCFSRARHHTRKFYRLSYYNPSSDNYGLGWDDAFLVAFWIVVFTGLRAVVMDYALAPLTQLVGLTKKKEKTRFAEQAWVLIYDSTFWSLGMYLMWKSDYWLDTRHLWTNWPNREMTGLFKWYYLAQFAFWLQQIVVVNIEERRKDHWQMMTHHIITSALMFTSYGYHQSKVGNTILCLMDVVDLLLPMLKYLRFQTACDIAFGAFMLVWFVARHVLYLIVCYSVYAEIPKEITYGCYWGSNANLKGPIEVPDDFDHLLQPFRDPEGLVCWDNGIKWAFLTALLALQVILLVWFGMIIRVALKVLKGGEAEDSRSDDEGSEEDEDVGEDEDGFQQTSNGRAIHMNARPIEVPPLEEEVGAESINLVTRKTSQNKRYRKMGSTASGVHLPSDRKELLGRIGCDKGA